MDSENDEEVLSYQIASILYPYLKQHENLIMVIQNAGLFVFPLKSLIFFLLLNFILLLLYFCHFSLYSYLCIFISFRTIPVNYTQKVFKFLLNSFTSSSDKEKYLISKPLPIDHISCLLAIFYVQIRNYVNYYVYAIKKLKLFDVAYLTILQFFIFYLIYLMSDSPFVWLCIHYITFSPVILAKRIGFNLFNFPEKTEKIVLERLQKKIREEEQIRKAEEERIRAQEALKADEELRRLAQIAISSEDIVKINDQKNENKTNIDDLNNQTTNNTN